MAIWRRSAAGAVALLVGIGPALATDLTIPFDNSRAAIGVDVSVKGMPLFMLLDTGVDPSTIDLARANALHLKVDRHAGDEASGVGNSSHAETFPATIDGLAIAGRTFGPVEALTVDMAAASAGYGRKIDGVLGYSFLKNESVLIDYPAHRLTFLAAHSNPAGTGTCRLRWTAPMRMLKDENWPIIDRFRLGTASTSVTLDTGSNGTVTLYPAALALPDLRKALVKTGDSVSSGLRGSTTTVKYRLDAPIGFGPFRLESGLEVSERSQGAPDGVSANVGNKVFVAMGLRMLLDYRHRSMTFFGGCH